MAIRAEIDALFAPQPGLTYLDSATYGLPPRPTIEVMQRALERWQHGAADWVTEWDMRGEACRSAFARLLDVPTDEIALIPSASVGVGLVAATLTDDDHVVIPTEEFNSVLYPLLVAARHRGATIEEVSFDDLADHVTSETTLVAFSLVRSQSGETASQREILDAAAKVGARSLVDATHAVPFV